MLGRVRSERLWHLLLVSEALVEFSVPQMSESLRVCRDLLARVCGEFAHNYLWGTPDFILSQLGQKLKITSDANSPFFWKCSWQVISSSFELLFMYFSLNTTISNLCLGLAHKKLSDIMRPAYVTSPTKPIPSTSSSGSDSCLMISPSRGLIVWWRCCRLFSYSSVEKQQGGKRKWKARLLPRAPVGCKGFLVARLKIFLHWNSFCFVGRIRRKSHLHFSGLLG